MTEPVSFNVVQCINAVAASVAAVAKSGDSGQGYNYRRIDDLMEAVHGPLTMAGVVIVPHVVEATTEPMERKNWTRTTLLVDYHVYGPAGDSLPTPIRVYAEAHNNADKGPGAALSYAWKSAIGQLLSLPSHDPTMDIEHPEPSGESDDERTARTELAAAIGAADPAVKAQMAEWLKSQRLTLRHPVTPEQFTDISNMFDEFAQSGAAPPTESSRPETAGGDIDKKEGNQ
jgi:ERF superfamily